MQVDAIICGGRAAEGPAEANAVVVHEREDAEPGAARFLVGRVGFDALQEQLAGVAGGQLGEQGAKPGARLRLCTPSGLAERVVLKRDKQAYKAISRKAWGDAL